jgi:peptide/nickel transport system substrate-binding protein
LTRPDGAGARVPDLAQSWAMESPTRWVFRLRSGLRFHDGTPLTALDVKATYDSVLDPAFVSPKREGLAAVAAISVPDALTVVFTLRHPFTPFLDATGLGILPAALVATGSRAVTVGSGPFRLGGFVRDSHVLLLAAERPPEERPRVPAILIRVIPDDTVRALELVRGDVHLVQNAVDPDMLPWLGRQPHLRVASVPGGTFHYLGLNLRDPHLGNAAVREAIALAIDREALIRHLLEGFATPATGLLSPHHWAYTADVVRYPYDPARAAALLDQAGYPDPDGSGPKPRFRLLYKGSTLQVRRRLAEALQAQLGAVGIALDLRAYEWGTLYADIRRGNFQLYALAWVGVSDPDIYYSLFHSRMTPPRGNNRGGYVDPLVDLLTETARRATDQADRRRLYAAVQRRVAETLPLIPLWWTPTVVVHARRLRGFEPDPDGNFRSLAHAWLETGSGGPVAGTGAG